MNATLLQFVNAKGSGEATLRRLANWTAREGVPVDEMLALSPAVIASTLEISIEVARNVLDERNSALKTAELLDSKDIKFLWLGDARYPERLRRILGDDAPPLIFFKGNIDLLNLPAVGFCGSRKASEKGIGVTGDAARILAKSNICVVSGYAHGVDLAAHYGALEAGGTTIFVLVDGILRFQLKGAISDVVQSSNHLIVSQFPPNLPWIGRNAMKRNGTIIGLSDAMILVESGIDGGTFAAGTESLKRRHPLFVVEFAEPGPSAEGNPFFLERGGIPLRGNRDGIPNLDGVLAVTRHPRWREEQVGNTLF
jgi:DNA processing protein